MKPSKKLNVGIIGFGKSGILHASSANMSPECRWNAVCDADEQVRRFISAFYPSVSVFSDAEEMLEKAGLDTLFICTPDHTHRNLAAKPTEQGLNIFVENPLAESLASARQMVDLASDKSLISSIGYYAPFQAVFQKARELLESGTLDTVKRYRASLQYSLPQTLPSRDQIIRIRLSDFFHLLTWLFGPVKSLYAKASDGCTVDTNGVFSVLDHSSGLMGILDVSWNRPGYPRPAVRISVEGTGGSLDISAENLKLYLTKKKGEFPRGWTSYHRADLPSPSRFHLCEEGYYEATRSFLASCSRQEQPVIRWEDGLEIIRMMEAADLSIAADREISLHEVK